MNGPRIVVAAVAAAHTPYARPWASPLKFAVSSASDPGTRIAPAAPWRTREATRNSMFGARPHSTLVSPNPMSPMRKTRRRP